MDTSWIVDWNWNYSELTSPIEITIPTPVSSVPECGMTLELIDESSV
jgi:hypothetical protein